MSTYTIQVRSICEYLNDLSEPPEWDNISNVVFTAAQKIFLPTLKTFDPDHTIELETKILYTYYTREIGFETYGLWKFHMNNKLRMLLPYYNQLYQGLAEQVSPYDNVNMWVKTSRELAENNSDIQNRDFRDTESGTLLRKESGDKTNTTNTNANDLSLFSATPQGSISGLLNMDYLTNATKNNSASTNFTSDTTTHDMKDTTEGTRMKDENVKRNGMRMRDEGYTSERKGKDSLSSYMELNRKYLDGVLNIDKMFVDEFADLFMGVW